MIDENKITELNKLIDEARGVSVEYIKLIKNTKNYNWEIKQLSLDIDQLEKINNELFAKFGETI